MPEKLHLALAQLNPIVGDVTGNIANLRVARQKAAAQGAHLIMTSELYICGYPPEDLVLEAEFSRMPRVRRWRILPKTPLMCGPAILLGTPWREGDKLYNSVLLLDAKAASLHTYLNAIYQITAHSMRNAYLRRHLCPSPIVFHGMQSLGVLVL